MLHTLIFTAGHAPCPFREIMEAPELEPGTVYKDLEALGPWRMSGRPGFNFIRQTYHDGEWIISLTDQGQAAVDRMLAAASDNEEISPRALS